jgi:hypothetical protein
MRAGRIEPALRVRIGATGDGWRRWARASVQFGLILTFSGVACCSRSPEKPLPNGYVHFTANSQDRTIGRSGGYIEIEIDGDVKWYTVIQDRYVAGRRGPICPLGQPPSARPVAGPFGYFLLDTVSGDFTLGLTSAELMDRLRPLGVRPRVVDTRADRC